MICGQSPAAELLALVFGFLLLAFSLVGWILNAWGPALIQ
jgi:hypothetical protein